MRVRSAAAALFGSALVALLVTGCVAPAPAPTPSPAPTTATPSPSSASPTSPPTPTPSATPGIQPSPAFSADDPGTWLIDFDGIGPLQLGTSLTDIETALPGAPDVCRPGVDGFFGGTVVAVANDATAPLQLAISQSIGPSADPAGAYPATSEGIAVGSTVDDLLATYPDIESYPGWGADAQPVYRIAGGSSWIHFEPYGGDVIREILVSTSDRVPKEYCG
ncbi:hypothetical protein N1027_01545 [Herbiconiux sp. CPCC 205763]|uniref:Uncharacterized protein n=1 Tax=Herbiconiux aconitum TaxID=2970913 RepID=A0ABT2GKR3_9MICO|nr:hypothetical protein [Herbiconiux aconitum]MCS5716814.1 hypothetical protein [Herbiconiux aconitum]